MTAHQPFPSADKAIGMKLSLPQVTLCAVTSVNVEATRQAMLACLGQIAFGACKLLTHDRAGRQHPGIEVVPIPRIDSARAYSHFLLSGLVDHVDTSHCLVVQWDGHVLDAARWQPRFLDYDYIGASWPQFGDGHDVGNGGFSLRSRRLMEACRAPGFRPGHPEDVAIGRTNRAWLEAMGMRFAPRELADAFAAERAGDPGQSFGFHGVFNMPRAIGVEAFWDAYRQLDERSTVAADMATLFKDIGTGRDRHARRARLIADRVSDALRRKASR